MAKAVDAVIAILLLIPLVALLAIPTYNHVNPNIGGFTFFYWYQIMWMPVSAVLFYIAALLWNRREKADKTSAQRKRKRSRR